jgi:hypothetical protein
MPLNHKPGEAQVDFGYALVKVSGTVGFKPVDFDIPAVLWNFLSSQP